MKRTVTIERTAENIIEVSTDGDMPTAEFLGHLNIYLMRIAAFQVVKEINESKKENKKKVKK